MKATVQIKTADFEFIALEGEMDTEQAVQAYKDLCVAYKGSEGLPRVEWNKVLDRYARGEGMSEDEMMRLSKAQAWWIKEYDKLLSRIKEN